MKVCPTGLIVRCFNVTIPICQVGRAKLTGKILSSNRSAFCLKTESDSAETKLPVASKFTR